MKCAHCGTPVGSRRRGSRYCSALCREADNRHKSFEQIVRECSQISNEELAQHDAVQFAIYGREGEDQDPWEQEMKP